MGYEKSKEMNDGVCGGNFDTLTSEHIVSHFKYGNKEETANTEIEKSEEGESNE